MQNLQTELRYDPLLAPQSLNISTRANATVYVDMAKYRKGLILVSANMPANQAANGLICQLVASANANGAGAANVSGYSVTLTNTDANNAALVNGTIAFDVSALGANNRYVAADVLSVSANATVLQVGCVRGAARYYAPGSAALGGGGAANNTQLPA